MQNRDMKSLRITVIFGLLAATIVGVLFIAGVLDSEAASSALTKTVGIVFLIAICGQAIGLLAKKPADKSSEPVNKQGPQF